MTREWQPRLVTALAALTLAAAACSADSSRTDESTKAPTLVSAPPARSAPAKAADLRLPARTASVRFAVIGDSGRGDRPQYDVAEQMLAYRKVFPYGFVLMLGDNVYDGGTREDYRLKFELPYKPLLDGGVDFYAVLGNHDDPNQQFYAPFHTGGQRYYTFKKTALGGLAGPSVRFFMIDTERLDQPQLDWFRHEALQSEEKWKIAAFHRPIYTSGRYARPARLLRSLLEPIITDTGITAAFSGHEHFYERIKPQQGVTYFISGGAGSLRVGDIRRTDLTEAGFDSDYHFMLIEITDEELWFQAISRTGATIDAGTIPRRDANATR